MTMPFVFTILFTLMRAMAVLMVVMTTFMITMFTFMPMMMAVFMVTILMMSMSVFIFMMTVTVVRTVITPFFILGAFSSSLLSTATTLFETFCCGIVHYHRVLERGFQLHIPRKVDRSVIAFAAQISYCAHWTHQTVRTFNIVKLFIFITFVIITTTTVTDVIMLFTIKNVRR